MLLIALLLVIRLGGKDGNPMYLGSLDTTFCGYGVVVGRVFLPLITLIETDFFLLGRWWGV